MKSSKTKGLTGILLTLFCISLVFLSFSSNGLAWNLDPMTVPSGTAPTLDGIKSEGEDWDSDTKCNTSLQTQTENFPNLKLHAMSSSNYLYFLVEVRITNPDDDQYIRILLSNSSDAEDDDFIDAKLIQNRNLNLTNEEEREFFIEDQHLDNGEYVNDTETNFFGAANVSGSNSYTYYEFKIPFALENDDDEEDTSIYGAGTEYAIKIQYGVNPEDGEETVSESPVLLLQVGLEPSEGDTEIDEYKIDIDLLSNIMFIIVGIGFAAILITSFQARSKLD